ncbi:MAG: hypothetical protein EOO50_10210 [Flavobacterium sp.]|uniref:hypothetical protein n=1 Tax=Flavobacterium sp. TaxID=239 RepID=UPI0011F91FE4|nr:hypothetical protein [Flavobacterium sp.]RZJ66296.1 MAG: hypothetical protein EOO50_10210 [Flavobacterium sp.]
MGTRQVNKDRKNFSTDEQKMGREDLDDRKLDRPFNELKDDEKRDGKTASKSSETIADSSANNNLKK